MPEPGPVSWAVPIRHALAEGGIEAAYACHAALKDGDAQDLSLDEDCLIIMALQLMMADKVDLAIDVLRLNIHAFPDYAYSHVFLAQLYLKRAQFDEARVALNDALAVYPDDEGALAMLAEIQGSGVQNE
jgi:tetratricopeptide (TPR) repeat protein